MYVHLYLARGKPQIYDLVSFLATLNAKIMRTNAHIIFIWNSKKIQPKSNSATDFLFLIKRREIQLAKRLVVNIVEHCWNFLNFNPIDKFNSQSYYIDCIDETNFCTNSRPFISWLFQEDVSKWFFLFIDVITAFSNV